MHGWVSAGCHSQWGPAVQREGGQGHRDGINNWDMSTGTQWDVNMACGTLVEQHLGVGWDPLGCLRDVEALVGITASMRCVPVRDGWTGSKLLG